MGKGVGIFYEEQGNIPDCTDEKIWVGTAYPLARIWVE